MEPTKKEIERILKQSEHKERALAVQEYRSSQTTDINTTTDPPMDFDILEIEGLVSKHPRYFKRVENIIPQVELYQLHIVGLYKGIPVTQLPTDDRFIYIPIGLYVYAKYTHNLEFIELCRNNTKLEQSFVSVIRGVNTIIKDILWHLEETIPED